MIHVNHNGIKAADFIVNLCDGPVAVGVPQALQHFRGAVKDIVDEKLHYYVVTFLQVAVVPPFMRSQERHLFLAAVVAQVAEKLGVSPMTLEPPVVNAYAWPEDALWAAMMRWEESHREILFDVMELRYFQQDIDGTVRWVGNASHATRLTKGEKGELIANPNILLPEQGRWITLDDYTFSGSTSTIPNQTSFMYKPQTV